MSKSIAAARGGSVAANGDGDHSPAKAGFWALTLGCIGVVYGDIGTSPLYALRESVLAASGSGHPVDEPVVLGILSLIIWALLLVVTAKYVLILLRADNNGEGGTLALMALASRALGGSRGGGLVILLGIISGALFYGDAIITPALSVLSAIEGLKVATPAFDDFVVPLTVVILIVLFAVQSRGTARVAAFFGPVTLIWFAAIAAAGLWHIGQNLSVLLSFNPYYGIHFLLHHGIVALYTLGAVFLVVTGAEALYADLGHFGRGPIRFAWLVVVLPALLINYLGQGALVLADPKAIENPFFLLFPEWALLPMVALATAATVIASQAVITGAYSLTQQAIQLGLLPRLEIRHTSEVAVRADLHAAGEHAAADRRPAAGGAVPLVERARLRLRHRRHRHHGGHRHDGDRRDLARVALAADRRAGVDACRSCSSILTFLSANLLKIVEGGWMPLALGAMVMMIMYTWRRGSRLLFEKTRRQEIPLEGLVASLEKKPPTRVPGTAVFLTSDPLSAPTALMHSLKHYKVLHEKNVILTIETADTPRVNPAERVRIEPVGRDLLARATCASASWRRRTCRRRWRSRASSAGSSTSCRRRSSCRAASLKPAAHSGMPRWQDRLFIVLTRAANDATDYFQIPTGRVVEVGHPGDGVKDWCGARNSG